MCKPVEANVTNLNNTIRLTDELERQLMLQAIEEQFRPHPMRALAAGLRKLAHGIPRPGWQGEREGRALGRLSADGFWRPGQISPWGLHSLL